MNHKLRGVASFWLLLVIVVPAIAGELDLRRVPAHFGLPYNAIGGTVNRIESTPDGRYTVWQTTSKLVFPQAPNGGIFWHDSTTGIIKPVSVQMDGTIVQANQTFAVSGNGRFVAFVDFGNFSAEPTSFRVAYVRDMITDTTVIVSRDLANAPVGAAYSQDKHAVDISYDGRFVGFVARAQSVDPSSSIVEFQAHVRDRSLGVTSRVPDLPSPNEGKAMVDSVYLSADGQYCVSGLSQLISANTYKSDANVARYDFATGQVKSLLPYTTTPATSPTVIDISSDGSKFLTSKRKIHDWTTDTDTDAYPTIANVIYQIHRMSPDATTAYVNATVDPTGQSSKHFYTIDLATKSIVADVALSAFPFAASNDMTKISVVADGIIQSVNMQTATTSIIAASYATDQPASGLTDVGFYGSDEVVFRTSAKNVAANQPTGKNLFETLAVRDIAKVSELNGLADVATGTFESTNAAGTVYAYQSGTTLGVRKFGDATSTILPGLYNYSPDGFLNVSVSADGRYVAYISSANPDGGVAYSTIPYRYDRESGAYTRLAPTLTGSAPTGGSFSPRVSDNGERIIFASGATNISPFDTLASVDLFCYDMTKNSLRVLSHRNDDPQSNVAPRHWEITASGKYAVFSTRKVLVPGASNAVNIYRYDLDSDQIELVSKRLLAGAGGDCNFIDMSRDGRYILVSTSAENIAGPFRNITKPFYTKLFVLDSMSSQYWPVYDPQGMIALTTGRFNPTGTTLVLSGTGRESYVTNLYSFEYGPRTKTAINLILHDGYTGPLAKPEVRLDFRGVATDPPFVITTQRNGSDQVIVTADGVGSYRVFASAAGFLRKEVGTVTLDGQPKSLGSFELLAGDVDGDNVVGLFDYLILSDAFGASLGDAQYRFEADFNRDSDIDLADYLPLSDNFDKVGDGW